MTGWIENALLEAEGLDEGDIAVINANLPDIQALDQAAVKQWPAIGSAAVALWPLINKLAPALLPIVGKIIAKQQQLGDT